MTSLKITRDTFLHEGAIPSRYTCDGVNVNPSLQIVGLPEKTKSLAIIVDAPSGTWVHWVVWNIPVSGLILENIVPGNEGMNDFGKRHYGGPCPPSGTHRYLFKVSALDISLQLAASASKSDLVSAMKTHLLVSGELMGTYGRL